MDTAVAKEQPPLAVGRLDDERRILVWPFGVLLEQDLAVVVDQGEPDEDLVPAVAVDVGDGGIMADGACVAARAPCASWDTPHMFQ